MSQSSSSIPLKWTYDRIIGRGSFASVYSGNLTDSNGIQRQIAVKMALTEHASSLHREWKIFKALRGCAEILTCFGGGVIVINGTRFYHLLLEFAPVGDLYSLIAKSGYSGIPEIEAIFYTKMILKGLHFIHSRGFVHCDIKPQNILAFPSSTADHSPCKYELKIGDFGLSVGPGERIWRGGTAEYMSPEAAVKKEVGPGWDVWSLGCTLVEMITGKTPWEDKISDGSEFRVYVEVLGRELPAIPEGMSQCGKDFLRKCFVRDVSKRWTVKMLLGHPYVTGFGLGRLRETKKVVSVGRFVLPNEKMIRGV